MQHSNCYQEQTVSDYVIVHFNVVCQVHLGRRVALTLVVIFCCSSYRCCYESDDALVALYRLIKRGARAYELTCVIATSPSFAAITPRRVNLGDKAGINRSNKFAGTNYRIQRRYRSYSPLLV